jgi:o-succinylbenzoate---CoA ligase
MLTTDQIYAWLKINQLAHLTPPIADRLRDYERSPIAYHVIATSDSEVFLVEFWAAVLAQVPVFLTDPSWGDRERQEFAALLASQPLPAAGQVLIPTGGTSGQLKFAIHSPATLTAATRGFQEFFGVAVIDSCCLLPLHHVSGLMQVWRSALTGGQIRFTSAPVPAEKFFLSLVPTQLQRYLGERSDWLRSFRAVIIGGAPLPEDLAIAARQQQLPLVPSYGSTETAALVTALPVAEFLAGRLSCGRPLPHVDLRVDGAGGLVIAALSLMAGYWPPSLAAVDWCDDLGEFDEWGHLQILGRRSQKIISGGEKVYPQEVEEAIRGTGLVVDVCAIGWPDQDWGEKVVAVYVPVAGVQVEDLRGAIAGKLSKFKQPKDWLAVASLPRNDRGKIEQRQLERLVGILLEIVK